MMMKELKVLIECLIIKLEKIKYNIENEIVLRKLLK